MTLIAHSTLHGVTRKEIDDNTLSHDASLAEIKDGIENANRNIEAANSVLSNLSEALKLDWLRKLGSELKGLVQSAMTINFATYHAVIRLESALPSHLERRLIEDPMILEDPIRRIVPVHLQFITSWEAFNFVLEERFHDREGYKKMKQREYGLQVGNTGKEIEQTRPWHCAFSPGQYIEMSFIFNQDDVDESSSTICPGCRTPSSHSTDADIQCTECQMFFRRITVIQDDESPSRVMPLAEDQHTRNFALRTEATDTGSRKWNSDGLSGRDEEDVRSFKRVRLISKRKLARRLGDGSLGVSTEGFGGSSSGISMGCFGGGSFGASARDFGSGSFGLSTGDFVAIRALVDRCHAQINQRADDQALKYIEQAIDRFESHIFSQQEAKMEKEEAKKQMAEKNRREVDLARIDRVEQIFIQRMTSSEKERELRENERKLFLPKHFRPKFTQMPK